MARGMLPCMMSEETSADSNVKIWKIKKLIKSLEMGTSTTWTCRRSTAAAVSRRCVKRTCQRQGATTTCAKCPRRSRSCSSALTSPTWASRSWPIRWTSSRSSPTLTCLNLALIGACSRFIAECQVYTRKEANWSLLSRSPRYNRNGPDNSPAYGEMPLCKSWLGCASNGSRSEWYT